MQKGISDSLGPSTKAPENGHKKEPQSEVQSPNQEEKEQNEIQIFPDKKTTVIFQFLYNPEYIGVGNPIVINMDNFKAFGTITRLIPERIDTNLPREGRHNNWATKSAKSGGRESGRRGSVRK